MIICNPNHIIMKSILKSLLFVCVALSGCSDKTEELEPPVIVPDDPGTSEKIEVTITLPENVELTVGESMDFDVRFSDAAGTVNPDEWECSVADASVATAEKGTGTNVTVTALAKGETDLTVSCTVGDEDFSKSVTVTVSEPVAEPEPGDGIVRVLAIGNSFSQDAVEQYLYEPRTGCR